MEHTQIKIKLPLEITDCFVGSGLLANLEKSPELISKNYSKFLLLSDTTTFALYGEKIISSLRKLGKEIVISLVPPGEKNKTLSAISQIVKPFFESGFDRKASLVALGGGVITDLGGFTASILLRGIDCINIPTTLLGQIDAALGGKTGVNFHLSTKLMLKNMIGIIRQPALVISDTDTLATLPASEILNGLGEMTKYWAGWGKPSISDLDKIKDYKNISPSDLAGIISQCQKIKAAAVKSDPFERENIRCKLNLGHTIGHAVEAAGNGKLSHGQSVAIGLAAAAKLSVRKGLLTNEACQMIISQLEVLGLPTKTKIADKKRVIQALKLDKKGGTFVLLKDIGNIICGVKVEPDLITQVLKGVVL